MHLLTFAGRYHLLESAELFIHFTPSSAFDYTVGSLSSHLLSSGRRCTLLLLGRSRGLRVGFCIPAGTFSSLLWG